MPPRKNPAASNASPAPSSNTSDSQVVMDGQNTNAVPPMNQSAMAAQMPAIPPLGQNAMATPIGIPPLGQNAMATAISVPPLGQNAMAAPIGVPPPGQNAMAGAMGILPLGQNPRAMSVPSLGSAPAAMMDGSNTNGKKAANHPGVSKMNMKPVREAKPKGSRRNISLPAKLTCSYLRAEKVNVTEGEDKPIWAVRVEVANGYPLMGDITDPPYPYEPFRFDGQKQLWYLLVKSEKMFHSVAAWLEQKASDHGMKFIDARQPWKDTMAITEMNIGFGWDGDEDNGEDVEWLNLSGEIWYLRNIAKDFGGRWSPSTKEWVSISMDAMPKLLQAIYDYGYPLTGNFNFDGRASNFLGSYGGYVDGECYKWQLHQSVTHSDE